MLQESVIAAQGDGGHVQFILLSVKIVGHVDAESRIATAMRRSIVAVDEHCRLVVNGSKVQQHSLALPRGWHCESGLVPGVDRI